MVEEATANKHARLFKTLCTQTDNELNNPQTQLLDGDAAGQILC
jgi:hypothetical protein